MILDFADEATEDIFHGEQTKAARRCLPAELWTAAQRKLDRLNRAREPRYLADPPGNRLEALKATTRDSSAFASTTSTGSSSGSSAGTRETYRSSTTTEVRTAMLPTNRPPTAPGAMLLEEFLKPRGVTQVQLASRMGVPIQRVNTIVNGKRGISAETAILLAEALDTTPEFWMGLQADHDLWHALRNRAAAKGKGTPTAARARRASAPPGRHRSA